ncbi:hypothetical protein TKK_0019279 [Trichogramma kaykai]
MVKKCIDHGIDLNCKKYFEMSPLVSIFDSNCCKIAELLMKNGADPNLLINPSFLIWVIKYNKTALIEILLKYEVNPNMSDEDGKAPLQEFCRIFTS